jgi:hypothetical protein
MTLVVTVKLDKGETVRWRSDFGFKDAIERMAKDAAKEFDRSEVDIVSDDDVVLERVLPEQN